MFKKVQENMIIMRKDVENIFKKHIWNQKHSAWKYYRRKISELEDTATKTMQSETQRGKKTRGVCGNNRTWCQWAVTHLTHIVTGTRKGQEREGGTKSSEEKMAKIFPTLMQTINPQTQEAKNKKLEEPYIKPYHNHITKTSNKEKTWEAAREKKRHIIYRTMMIRVTTDSSSQTTQMRREWSDTCKALGKKLLAYISIHGGSIFRKWKQNKGLHRHLKAGRSLHQQTTSTLNLEVGPSGRIKLIPKENLDLCKGRMSPRNTKYVSKYKSLIL